LSGGGAGVGAPCSPDVAALYPPGNVEFAGRRGSFVNDRSLQLALREMQAVYANPLSLATMAAAVALLTLGGPFGTATGLGSGQRFLYWAAVVCGTYTIGRGLAPIVAGRLNALVGNRWVRLAILGLVLAVPISLFVCLVEAVAYGRMDAARAFNIAINATAICLVFTGLLSMLDERFRAIAETPPNAAAPAGGAAPILERLPREKRGRLVSLSVEDHYVEVVTDRGRTLVLMRLGDAIRETGGIDGVQIHRSHWVAREAVVRGLRREGKPMVELADGRVLPVSRSFAPMARAAGIV
jgi:hypothetical protein